MSNIKAILPELFSENLIRGRGLFCRSMMKAQMASPAFSSIYAALVAVVNTKFPEIGDLLLNRWAANELLPVYELVSFWWSSCGSCLQPVPTA